MGKVLAPHSVRENGYLRLIVQKINNFKIIHFSHKEKYIYKKYIIKENKKSLFTKTARARHKFASILRILHCNGDIKAT